MIVDIRRRWQRDQEARGGETERRQAERLTCDDGAELKRFFFGRGRGFIKVGAEGEAAEVGGEGARDKY
ncbi:unnamed protein product [Linum tenue]|uniref:Uncharacterized protein n=1 Tax=Linum tenue TaxID=586396 RepID=A0AAV0P3I7_9ROSI|nr:unnamed protein product [Linum tenue]